MNLQQEPVSLDPNYFALIVFMDIFRVQDPSTTSIYRVLLKRGFPEQNIDVLSGKVQADEFRQAVSGLTERIESSESADNPRPAIILYMHGKEEEKTRFVFSDRDMPTTEFYDIVSGLPGNQRFLGLPMCFGGATLEPIASGEVPEFVGYAQGKGASYINTVHRDRLGLIKFPGIAHGLEQIAQEHPQFRVNLADADYQPNNRYGSLFELLQSAIVKYNSLFNRDGIREVFTIRAYKAASGEYLF